LVATAEAGSEFLAGAAAVPVAYFTSRALHTGPARGLPLDPLILFSVLAGILAVLLFERDRMTPGWQSLLRIRETERALRASCLALALLVPLAFVSAGPMLHGASLSLTVILPALLLVERHAFLSAMQSLQARGYPVRQALRYPTAVERSSWIGALAGWIPGPPYPAVKRFLDVLLSSLLLTALSPFLLLVALLVRFDSPGPALFRQERIGTSGRTFKIVKFRSMYTGAPKYARSPATAEDSRITPFGRVIRRTSVDELPQLVNVLRGEMSLVGPRPEMPFLVEEYDATQRQRLQVVPGITGLWQLGADRASLIHENLEYDLYYIRHRGLFLDAAILIHTVFSCMRGI
jgi:lipopolysaccharide/colanic/teichoic acid biosynthesis glycosyltransferase